jgi:hypothetical protein
VPPTAVPYWLECFSAFGSGVAGVAALSAVVVWQIQNRAQRRSDTAERALVAVHLFGQELGLVCKTLVSIADADISESVTEEYVADYTDAMENAVSKFRRDCEREIRDLEVAVVRARAVLSFDEAKAIDDILVLFLRVRAAVLAHTALVESGGWTPRAIEAFHPIREAQAERQDLEARAEDLLGPVARFEPRWWRKMAEECRRNFDGW